MNVGSVFNLFLLFSDPELGQVQPGSGGNLFQIIGICIVLYLMVILADILYEVYKSKRRRRD